MTLEERKASLHPIQTNIILIDNKLKEKWNDEPKDRYYFVHVLFIFLGLMNSIPYTFFLTANAYWMYKFRNASAEITDADARTTLQTHFSPDASISGIVPVAVCMLVSTFYGHKIKARSRVLGTLFVFTFCFLLMSGFVKTNTDSWQLEFFILTMAVLAVIHGTDAVLSVAALVILSKFPRYYLKVYLIGQGLAGILNSLLQITSLAIGTSTTTSALIYFVTGSAMMAFTSTLQYFSKYNTCYNWYANIIEENTKRKVIPFSEMKSLLKILWPYMLTYAFCMLTVLPVHTPITALVVSENYGNGSLWNDKYFVPVITYLYTQILSVLGRIVNTKMNMNVNKYLLNGFMLVRMIIFLPLVYFCNAHPRYHSDVLFPHDWQYIIIIGVLLFTYGYTFNMVFLEVRKSVEVDKVEDAFMIFMSGSALVSPVTTLAGLFAVELL